MKRLTSTVSYQVPEWEYCNYAKGLSPSDKKCRFCSTHGKVCMCMLYNLQLMTSGNVVYKTDGCMAQTIALKSKATIDPPEEVSESAEKIKVSKSVIRSALTAYHNMYNECLAAGCGEKLSHTIALESVLK